MTEPVAQTWRPPADADSAPDAFIADSDATASSAADAGVSGLFADVRRLMDDGKTLASAEIAYQTMRATVAATAAKSIIGYGAIAAVLGLFAMVALTVGLLLALTPLVTAWGATAIVVGGYALIAFLCVKRASRRWQDAKATLAGTETVQ